LGGLVMIIPVMIIFLVAQKYIVQGLAAGAVKE
jgi:ABC-type maltose transport system permease subunit